MSKIMYIRPSHLVCYDMCPRMYYYRYVLNIKCEVISANLPFGTALHTSITGYVLSKYDKSKSFDPVKVFEDTFEAAINEQAIDFSSLWDKDAMFSTGRVLAERFPDVWDRAGLMPLFDEDGPVVERRFQVKLSESLVLTGQPDIVFMNSDGATGVLDIKSTSSAYKEVFLHAAEQLTDYQILLEAHSESLFLDQEGISLVGFMELVKKKVPVSSKAQSDPLAGPQVHVPQLINSRSVKEKQERIHKIKNIALDIQRGRFERRPLMAFNSPCELCDFKDYCLQGEKEGLIFPAGSSLVA